MPLNYEIPFKIVEDIFVLRYDLCFLETDYVVLNNMLWLITKEELEKLYAESTLHHLSTF